MSKSHLLYFVLDGAVQLSDLTGATLMVGEGIQSNILTE